MDADATDGPVLFDHRHALSGRCSLDGVPLAHRAGANNDQVIRLHSKCLGLPIDRPAWFGSPVG